MQQQNYQPIRYGPRQQGQHSTYREQHPMRPVIATTRQVLHRQHNQQEEIHNLDIRADVDHYNLQPEGATQCVATDGQNKDQPEQDPILNHELMAQMKFLYQQGSGMSQVKSTQVSIKRVLQEKIFK